MANLNKKKFKSEFLHTLSDRGFIHQTSNDDDADHYLHNENGDIVYLDCLVNDVHLRIQSELWYDKTDGDLANKVIEFKHRILQEIKMKFQREYKRRGFLV